MNILSIEVDGGFLKFGPHAILLRKPRAIAIPCIIVIILCTAALFWVSHTKSLGMWASDVKWFVQLIAIVDSVALGLILLLGIKDKSITGDVQTESIVQLPLPKPFNIRQPVEETHEPYKPKAKVPAKKAAAKKPVKKVTKKTE